MDLDEIEGTHWWRVCVAAGWISHPCLFSFAISTDAKRIEAVSALSWNVAEHHVFLCSRAFRLFAAADETAATGSEEAEWGDVGVGWERVWWISLFDVSAEMKKKISQGASSFSFSRRRICTLLRSFDQQKPCVRLHVHRICESGKVCSLAHLCFCKQAARTFVGFFYCYNLWRGRHSSYIMNECVCAHSLSCLS